MKMQFWQRNDEKFFQHHRALTSDAAVAIGGKLQSVSAATSATMRASETQLLTSTIGPAT
jgi:hypothetical protein